MHAYLALSDNVFVNLSRVSETNCHPFLPNASCLSLVLEFGNKDYEGRCMSTVHSERSAMRSLPHLPQTPLCHSSDPCAPKSRYAAAPTPTQALTSPPGTMTSVAPVSLANTLYPMPVDPLLGQAIKAWVPRPRKVNDPGPSSVPRGVGESGCRSASPGMAPGLPALVKEKCAVGRDQRRGF